MKRIISLLLALVIAISAAIPAYATGDGRAKQWNRDA